MSLQTDVKDGYTFLRHLKTPLICLSPVAFALALAWMSYEAGRGWGQASPDMKYFWLAGEFWNAGLTPYDEAYTARLAEIAGPSHADGAWNYTPNWYFISILLAKLDVLTAHRLWLCLSAVLLMAGSALNAACLGLFSSKSAIAKADAPLHQLVAALPLLVLFFLHASYMGLSQAAEKTLELGQSSLLIYFGLSLLVWAILRERLWAGAIGLAIIMLKAQFGILIVAALLFSRLGRRVTFAAAVISILMALPAFFISSPFDIASDLLRNVSAYGGQVFNTAVSTTGLRNIVWTLGGAELGMLAYQLMALVFIGIFCAVLYLRAGAPPKPVDLVMLAVAAAHLFAPYHYYDFAVIGVLIYFCASLRTGPALISLFAFLVILRAGNLPNMPTLRGDDLMAYGGNVYMTVAGGILLAVMARELLMKKDAAPA